MSTAIMSRPFVNSPVRVDVLLTKNMTFQEATEHLLGYFKKRTISVYDSCVLRQDRRQATPKTAFHMYQTLQDVHDIECTIYTVLSSICLNELKALQVNFLEWLNLYKAASALERVEQCIILKGGLIQYFSA